MKPTPFAARHYLASFNPAAAGLLDLDSGEAQRPEFVEFLRGLRHLPGSEPLATLYAGHQFGHYVTQLGDGRALLLGEVCNSGGERWEVQLKGSGPTPYSRGGDGRAVLRSTIREYLCSEAMHGLGIPTTRALCIIGGDAKVHREEAEQGAMLVRLSPSHVRFGSFEVFFHREQPEQVRTLADYVIAHHFHDFAHSRDRYFLLLAEIVERTARLIAQWQAVGFAHGVMNTDNMSVLGVTLDCGPFGFMDHYDAGLVCNHSDHTGRYAFDQQPQIGLWNLTRLAQALTPVLAVEQARDALTRYESTFVSSYGKLMFAKLGIRRSPDPHSISLLTTLLDLLQTNRVDYTNFFRALSGFDTAKGATNHPLRDMFLDREGFDRWARDYVALLKVDGESDMERGARLRQVNPKYVLRNYLAQRAIERATTESDFSEVERLLGLLRDPFAEHVDLQDYANEPPDWAQSIQVSCSS